MTTADIHSPISIRGGRLFIEDCDAAELANRFGTPLFVVSETQLVQNYHNYQDAFERHWPEGRVRTMGAIKANPITAIRKILTREGCGCDTFGHGELELALRGGVAPSDIALNGSIKSPELIGRAIELGVHIVLDSIRELEFCEDEARRLGKKADVVVRLKPWLEELDEPSDFFPARTIRDMTQTVKYGIPASDLPAVVERLSQSQHLRLIGAHTHSGRHSKKLEFWESLIRNFVKMIADVRAGMGGDWTPQLVSIGGGFAAQFDRESRVAVTNYQTPTAERYAEICTRTFREAMMAQGMRTDGIVFEIEPGRALHNETGIHLARIEVIKRETAAIDRVWAETDTSEVFLSVGSLNMTPPFDYVIANKADAETVEDVDIVGITCNYECLAEQQPVPHLESGDVLAFLNTGSYIEPYACNFNALPRPGTVLVKGSEACWIKRPETQEEVFARDIVPERLAEPIHDDQDSGNTNTYTAA
ncbi:MAG: hypothetical protein AB3N20_00070 [Rhizobiaceae bacterium]